MSGTRRTSVGARAVVTAVFGIGLFSGCSGVSRDPLAHSEHRGGNSAAVAGDGGMTTNDSGGAGEAPTNLTSISAGAGGEGGEDGGDAVAAGGSGGRLGSGGEGVVSGSGGKSGSIGNSGATVTKAGQAGGGSIVPKFELVWASGRAKATATCPADKPRVVGTGARGMASLGLQSVVPEPHDSPNADTVRVVAGAGETTTAYAVCSDAVGAQTWETWSSSNHSDVWCGAGMVAIGGGGECTGGGMLFRSRPIPDQPGTKPSGWRASCTSGSVTSYAICVTAVGDFSDCHTERVDALGNALVRCPDHQTALTAGGYCSTHGLLSIELDAELTKVNLACVDSTAQANAYAICCGW